jgi:Zn-dependent protease with chaperone function
MTTPFGGNNAFAHADTVDPRFAPFDQPLEPIPVSHLYRVALLAVAVAIALLPIMYVSLIACIAYLIQWHVRNNVWILSSTETGLGTLLAYFCPIVVGGIAVFFVIKPFFARTTRQLETITLKQNDHPSLFALVQGICAAVKAPMPVRIEVDCSINAAARLIGGPFGHELALTIGLPLAAGLTVQQLAGILGHECGHFAQGAGVRLTYIIHSINRWFWRVVHERDEWDAQLVAWSTGGDFRLAVVFLFARAAVSCTRRLLWALMTAGHLISCLMLRQMEFDADSYETRLVGSDCFGHTMARARATAIAIPIADTRLRQSFTRGYLPDDMASFITDICAALPADLIVAARPRISVKSRWFESHPSDGERIEAARLMNVPGIFTCTDRAADLFGDFESLSRVVTRHHYERSLRLNLGAIRLIDADALMQESRKDDAAGQAYRRIFAEGATPLHPIFVDFEVIGTATDPVRAWESFREARAASKMLATTICTSYKRFAELEDRKRRAKTARLLLEASYYVRPEDAGLSKGTIAETDTVIAHVSAEQKEVAEEARRYEEYLRGQFIAAGQLLQLSAGMEGELFSSALRGHARAMIGLLMRLNGAYNIVLALRERILLFDSVRAQARTLHDPARLNPYASKLEDDVRMIVARVRSTVSGAFYPFAHASRAMTLAQYLRGPDVTTEDLEAVIRDARTHVDLFLELYCRIIGELALIAEHIERSVH